MARINQKIMIMQDALRTLQDSLLLLEEFHKDAISASTVNDERIFLACRDSVIQRFEYCADLFWKVLRIYLEDVEKVTISINSPASIIRDAVQARIMTEQQGHDCIEMIKSRNRTSHIYHQEVAQDIAEHVPMYHQLMRNLIDAIGIRIQK